MRPVPFGQYCNSAALGCQCNSRMPAGAIVRSAPVIVAEIGNSVSEAMRISPPANGSGACAKSR
jgi:hypothetical protein